MPGVVFLDMVLRALEFRGFSTSALELRDILFIEPIATTEHFDRRVRIRFAPQDEEGRVIRVVAESWPIREGRKLVAEATENFRCEVHVGTPPLTGRLEVEALLRQARTAVDMDEAYAYARQASIEHFEFMKGLGRIHSADDSLLADIHLGELAHEYLDQFLLHPAYLDSSTLVPFLYLLRQRPDVARHPFIPIHIESFRAAGPLGERVLVQVRQASTGLVAEDVFHSDIDFYSPGGEHLASLRKLSTKRIRSETLIARLQALGEDGRAAPEPPPPEPVHPGNEDAKPGQSPLDYLRHLVASELKVEPGSLDDEENFYAQGLDSAHLLHIVQRLERELRCRLYPTLLFEHSTLTELAAYLAQHHAEALKALTRPPPAPPPATEPLRPSGPPPATSGQEEPIAIIGLAGRYPMAEDLDTFWDNLRAGRDCITEIPRERWEHERWFDPAPERPGRSYGKWGGFLEGIDRFEPLLFNLSPREAELM
ncbi:MAG TPA: beta-ketoacyl synthase N-terminal-like domain-containing protein, partial [Myxococcaceae bacterium]|nr:beta-ketoacyl synthase N-terminal-like domain-containing protein [Myxococcaceae bacterium]